LRGREKRKRRRGSIWNSKTSWLGQDSYIGGKVTTWGEKVCEPKGRRKKRGKRRKGTEKYICRS